MKESRKRADEMIPGFRAVRSTDDGSVPRNLNRGSDKRRVERGRGNDRRGGLTKNGDISRVERRRVREGGGERR